MLPYFFAQEDKKIVLLPLRFARKTTNSKKDKQAR